MLERIFIALCQIPGLKKPLWQGWYGYLARRYGLPDWTFMNYGYTGVAASQKLNLDPADEADRYCIQLYHHVAGAVDLRGRDILEVGSGRGGGASFIKRYLEPGRMVGVDLSQKAVDFCRSRHHAASLEFMKGDAERLPFPAASFDAVVNVESSHCYPSFPAFLSEVRRVLRPGGRFLYADFRDRASVKTWKETIQKAGLQVTCATDITANVLAALEADDRRKNELIRKMVPRPLRRSFENFAAVRGSKLYESFQSGNLAYWSFVAESGTEENSRRGAMISG